jgi:pyruvate-formate lyase-activating enzyme
MNLEAQTQQESKLSEKFAEMDKALEKIRRNYEELYCRLQPFINDGKLKTPEGKKEEIEEMTSPAINTLSNFIKTIKEMDKDCSNLLNSLEL